ncbi:protein LNK4-like isoform X2 [Tripterygium wilfordii]|uniref:protein LNK4-like isoform X2 n=1 Tax=Tripterygium wilfordii TaxID=458696 RepID=UPI0018F840CD|nr:protein LNK4-like isoform X2 [Tripterygium wilfordii]
MDCYFRSVIDDFVVPKDQGISGLSQREMNPSGEVLCDEDRMDASIRGNKQSSSLSLCEGSVDDIFHQTTTSRDRPDCQLDDLVEIDTMDDIFLDSFLEDLPRTENPWKSFCLSPESECNSMLVDSLSKDMILDSQSFSSDERSIGSSKYLRTHDFSSAVDWKREANASQFLPCTTIEASQINTSLPSEQNSIDECVDKETSVEESVLQELEMVMTQLTDKTRICFRDAFYRLANNTEKHTVGQKQIEDISLEIPPLMGRTEKERFGRKKATESETNIIDRTIASLLFGNMQMFVEDSPVEKTANAGQEATRVTGTPNHILHQRYPIYTGDAEVPIHGHGHLQAAVDHCRDVSEIPPDNKMDKVYDTGVRIHD